MSLKDELIAFEKNVASLSEGYKSWGEVTIQQVTIRDGQADEISAAIFKTRKNINCVMITRQLYASTLKEEVPPILDDQAQLLGVSVKVAKGSNAAAALKALNSRYAAVMSDGRCICIGGTVEDAYIAAQLLEKTAKAWIEAKHIGGAKSINRFEAWAMQMYYQFKYAKEAKKNR